MLHYERWKHFLFDCNSRECIAKHNIFLFKGSDDIDSGCHQYLAVVTIFMPEHELSGSKEPERLNINTIPLSKTFANSFHNLDCSAWLFLLIYQETIETKAAHQYFNFCQFIYNNMLSKLTIPNITWYKH